MIQVRYFDKNLLKRFEASLVGFTCFTTCKVIKKVT